MVLFTSTHALAAIVGGFVDVTYKVADNVDAFTTVIAVYSAAFLTTTLLVTTPLAPSPLTL